MLPGCEAFALDAAPNARQRHIAALLLHGFTGNPRYLRGLGEFLAGEGIAVLCPRLPGHGTSVEDMATTGWDDWSRAAHDAYEEVRADHTRIAVVGLSMGGMLTLEIAAHRRDDPKLVGAVALAPAYDLTWGAKFALATLGRFVRSWPRAEISGVDTDAIREMVVYHKVPIRCARELRRGVRSVRRKLERVRAPLLVVDGKLDNVVPKRSAPTIIKRVASRDIAYETIEESGHLLTVDRGKERVYRLVGRFIRDRARDENAGGSKGF